MIIDSHVHFGTNSLFSMPEDMVLEFMDKYKVDKILASDICGTERDHLQVLFPEHEQTSQIDIVKRSLAFAKLKPEKIKIAIWIKPYLETCDEDFQNLIRNNLDVIKAIKLHPYHSKVAPDDPRLEPYYKLAEECHLPVVSHTGGCEEASSTHLLNAALTHPNINFVMVHMDLGTNHLLALENLGKAKNLYADTTWVPLKTTLEVVKRYGSEKILFGSDAPIDGVDTYIMNPKKEPSLYVEYFKNLENSVSKKDYDNIMYLNSKRLFHF